MDEKELQEKFFWTANAVERQRLLDINLPQFSLESYKKKTKDYYETRNALNEADHNLSEIQGRVDWLKNGLKPYWH